ncbi:MAG: cyclic pyranopterin monophosphate synthase MoaC [Planctomycetota bacterium]|nr:cyclic pyranopterin monophosphate synthase MoaC [Planctomycetota bacterium]
MSEPRLTHLDDAGRAHMVDVASKPATLRRAVAEGRLVLAAATLALLQSGQVAKGDALAVARVAGIQGAKRAAEWIPLCHPVRLDAVQIAFEPEEGGQACAIRIRAEVVAVDRTGVEMEAMTAVAAAGLALYDMIKGVDRSARLADVCLLSKEGGRSGVWRRDATHG